MGSDVDIGLLLYCYLAISIHAPRMGSDLIVTWSIRPDTYFNPRSPDGERLDFGCRRLPCLEISIHAPRMGSDRLPRPAVPSREYFNPRSPDGERPCGPQSTGGARLISIHAPRMGSDPLDSMDMTTDSEFQSTLPGWGATQSADRTLGR